MYPSSEKGFFFLNKNNPAEINLAQVRIELLLNKILFDILSRVFDPRKFILLSDLIFAFEIAFDHR